jgi:acetyl esterase/lipase
MATFSAATALFEQDPEPWVMPPVTVLDETAPGPHGPVDVRIYAPENVGNGLITWIHGGAFMIGDLDMPESHMVGAELAHRSGRAVVAIGYRLAVGGVRHPVPLDDCVAAWRWAVDEWGAAAPGVTLGGASAGATLALGCALLDREHGRRPADALALVYPFVHYPMPAGGAELAAELAAELPAAMRFTPEFTDAVIRNYLGRIHDVPPLVIPGTADLRALPPVSITVAEYDDLRPSGEIFARQLRDADVDVALRVAEGMPHGYLNRTTYLDEVGLTLADILAATSASRP